MKKQTIVIFTLIILVVQHILRLPYYKYILSDNFRLSGNIRGILDLFVISSSLIVDLIMMVLGVLAIGSSTFKQKEKAYTYLRYMFVVTSIFALLIDVYYFSISGRYFFHEVVHAIVRLLLFPSQVAVVIFLIKTRPQQAVPKVNLQHYDMVTYTTNGHRFLHYLLDVLFMIPIWLVFTQLFVNMSSYYGMSDRNSILVQLGVQVTIAVSFLLYYFLSEALFSQTFGKMITGSCVVTNGVEFTGGRMLTRTMCRLIPFDRFSFLFGANWHDKVSATAVVYVDSWETAFKDKEDSGLTWNTDPVSL